MQTSSYFDIKIKILTINGWESDINWKEESFDFMIYKYKVGVDNLTTSIWIYWILIG